MRRSSAFPIGAIALLLAGCAAPQSGAPAFSRAVHGAQDAFAAARSAENDAFFAQAMAQPDDIKVQLSPSCTINTADQVPAAKGCTISYLVGGKAIDTSPAGPNLTAAMAVMAQYADAMALAATAKDLDDRKAAMAGLAQSIGRITSAAGIPGIGEIAALLADAEHQRELKQRYKILGKIAQSVDPAVRILTDHLGLDLLNLRANIVFQRSSALTRLNDMNGRTLRAADPARAETSQQLAANAESLRRAAAIKTDFSALGMAHREMIESLLNPKPDLSTTIDAIQTLATDAGAIKSAFSSGK